MPENEAKRIPSQNRSRGGAAGRILLVDDEDRNLRLLQAILTPEGHDVFTARTGEEALKKVRELSPDLILLDVMMPEMDGYQVLSGLRDNEPGRDIPVIMVTSLDDTDSRVRALEAGADDFVTKPIVTPVLTARVDSLLKVKAYYDSMKDQTKLLEEEVARKTDKLKRYSKQLEILNQAGIMINSVLDIPSILRSVAKAALELWRSSGGAAGIVDDGKLLFKDWYWAGEHNNKPLRCDILDHLRNMTSFMEVIHCENYEKGNCEFSKADGVEINKCLVVPVYDRQLEIQACLLLFNPDETFSGQAVIDHPLPGLISSAATALDNTRNLTELREKEEALQSSLMEKDLLLKEIHHRVKNNLQAIVGLMEAHLGTVQDPKDRQVFLKGQSLAMSISMIHELLYKTDDYTKVDFSQYIRQLVLNSLNLYPDIGNKIQINVEMKEMYLNSDTAVPVSLIINELVSNALIHAFPDDRTGTVTISGRQYKNGKFQLEVVDDGIGLTDTYEDPDKQALGLSLVQSLVENLHGSMKVKVNEGTRITLRFKEYFECENQELADPESTAEKVLN
jgi:two-component sensor histidine kinase/DNA-binding NarL/FixJ family response regulator